jgi:choline dehydrogenase-like flavoprotein
VIALRILAEQVPDRESRITLADQRDPAGRRVVALDWRISDVDREMIRRHQDLLADVIERRNLGTVVDRLDLGQPMPFTMSNHHHLGGTRMHANKRAGVVDAESRVHTAPNLFVTGGSVFPTGGYLNPTLTVIALAMRLAGTIKQELRPVRVGS